MPTCGMLTLTPCNQLSISQTVFRIVVLGIWDYIENKVEVSSRGAVSELRCHCLNVSARD